MTYLWSPTKLGLETAVHSLLGVLYAAFRRPAIIHLHAIGPAVLAPLARMLGLRVVVTHHGAAYRQEKWGWLAKSVLRAGEWFGVRFAHRCIVVSEVLQAHVREQYGIETRHISNGAPWALITKTDGALREIGVESGRYVLCVARLDPTKRLVDLIDAFERAALASWKLVLVGAIDSNDVYTQNLIGRADASPRIRLTGFRTGRSLRELYSHSGMFVLPSAMEGHPIALLEALSYGNPVLASAIPENLVVPMPRDCFFEVGDVQALAELMDAVDRGKLPRDRWAQMPRLVKARYRWSNAARLTRDVYDEALAPRH